MREKFSLRVFSLQSELDRAVMPRATALPIGDIPEKFLITFVWHHVINNCCRALQPDCQTTETKWILPAKLFCRFFPALIVTALARSRPQIYSAAFKSRHHVTLFFGVDLPTARFALTRVFRLGNGPGQCPWHEPRQAAERIWSASSSTLAFCPRKSSNSRTLSESVNW